MFGLLGSSWAPKENTDDSIECSRLELIWLEEMNYFDEGGLLYVIVTRGEEPLESFLLSGVKDRFELELLSFICARLK